MTDSSGDEGEDASENRENIQQIADDAEDIDSENVQRVVDAIRDEGDIDLDELNEDEYRLAIEVLTSQQQPVIKNEKKEVYSTTALIIERVFDVFEEYGWLSLLLLAIILILIIIIIILIQFPELVEGIIGIIHTPYIFLTLSPISS